MFASKTYEIHVLHCNTGLPHTSSVLISSILWLSFFRRTVLFIMQFGVFAYVHWTFIFIHGARSAQCVINAHTKCVFVLMKISLRIRNLQNTNEWIENNKKKLKKTIKLNDNSTTRSQESIIKQQCQKNKREKQRRNREQAGQGKMNFYKRFYFNLFVHSLNFHACDIHLLFI